MQAAAQQDSERADGRDCFGFTLPGQWTAIDATLVDFDPARGELTLPWNVLGLPYNEVQVTYTAGLTTIGDDVKSACARICATRRGRRH